MGPGGVAIRSRFWYPAGMEKKQITLWGQMKASLKNGNWNWKNELCTLGIILVMVTIQCAAINGLYKPNGLISGGLTGVGMLLEYVTGFPSWLTILLLNIPLLLLAVWKLHFKFTLYTIIASLYFSAAMAMTARVRIPFDWSNPLSQLTGVLLGAVICGAAAAPIVRRGASTGGIDILALLLSKKFSFPMGTISYGFNILITGALAFVKGLDKAALAMLVMFVSSTVFNNVLLGLNRTKTLFIISDRWEDIAPHVLREVHRGVTLIPAKGAYTGQDKTLVYVLARTMELAAIRRIVLDIDPSAMLSIIDTREVVGRGFTPNN